MMLLRQTTCLLILFGSFSCSNSTPKLPDGQKRLSFPREAAVANDSPLVATDSRALEREIHTKINAYRSSKGLKKLAYDSLITKFAREHSTYMRNKAAREGNDLLISHDNLSERMASLASVGGPRSTAENVAVLKGLSKIYVSTSFTQGWIDSRGHHKNIVGDYTHSGVGVVIGKDNVIYATQIFGK